MDAYDSGRFQAVLCWGLFVCDVCIIPLSDISETWVGSFATTFASMSVVHAWCSFGVTAKRLITARVSGAHISI